MHGFSASSETYAIEMRYVREVHPLKDLTPIPCTPAFVLGVINVRGQLCPMVELKHLLGAPARGLTNATRAVIIHDATMEFGIVADAILGVRSVATADILPAPATLFGVDSWVPARFHPRSSRDFRCRRHSCSPRDRRERRGERLTGASGGLFQKLVNGRNLSEVP